MNKKMLDALASAIYVSKLSLAGETVTEDDQKIRAAGLYPDWEAGNHAKGEIYNTHAGDSLGNEWEQTWECYQAYDNASYPAPARTTAADQTELHTATYYGGRQQHMRPNRMRKK